MLLVPHITTKYLMLLGNVSFSVTQWVFSTLSLTILKFIILIFTITYTIYVGTVWNHRIFNAILTMFCFCLACFVVIHVIETIDICKIDHSGLLCVLRLCVLYAQLTFPILNCQVSWCCRCVHWVSPSCQSEKLMLRRDASCLR